MCTITASTNVSCNGLSDGSLMAEGTGGSGAFEYSLDGVVFQSGGSFIDLAAGSYTVTVRNVGNPMCISTCNITITEPALLSCTTMPTDASCDGGSDGEAEVIPTGGTGPYTYLWDDAAAQTTAVAVNLAAGMYTVVVTDANGCITTCEAQINAPLPLTCTLTGVDVLCNGDATGSITVANSGGTIPVEYLSLIHI